LRESVDLLTSQKKSLFDDLQSRRAELESSQYRLDELHTQIRELQYQLREANERLAVLNELAETRQEQGHNAPGSSTSAEDVAHLLYAAESKYEAKIAELRQGLASVERERNEADAEWSRKFREKVREMEDLRRTFELSAKASDPRDEFIDELKAEIALLRDKVTMHGVQVTAVDSGAEKLKEVVVRLCAPIPRRQRSAHYHQIPQVFRRGCGQDQIVGIADRGAPGSGSSSQDEQQSRSMFSLLMFRCSLLGSGSPRRAAESAIFSCNSRATAKCWPGLLALSP
jgi:hypothetical protein